MSQLTVEQMVQLAKQSKSESSKQKSISVDDMVALAKSNKPTKDLGTLPAMKFEVDIGKPSAAKSFILGAANEVGGGINQLVSGAKDLGSSAINRLLGTNLKTNRYDEVTQEIKAVDGAYEKSRAKAGQTGTDGWRTAGSITASIPMMTGGVGKTLVSTAAKSGALGALVGGAQFAGGKDRRISNIQSGALGGAAGGVIGKKIGDGVTRIVNAKKGNYRDDVKEIIEQGEKHGIRTSVGDVGRNPLVRKAEVQMEELPLIGTAGFRKAQHDEAQVAANTVVDKLKSKLDDVDFKSIPQIQASASAGDKNAIRILGVVNGAGDDTGKILQAAAEIKGWRGQRVASQMYDRVQKLAGDGAIAPNKTVQAIDNIIANDSKVIPNTDLQKELLAIRKTLGDMNIKKDFREMRAVQSRLGEIGEEWGRQGKSTSNFTAIRTAIDDDIIDFAQSSGNTRLFGELKRANALYGRLQEGKDKALTASMKSDTPDEIFEKFMKAGKGDRAANFYKNLDPKGRAALRYQMAQNALDKATNISKESFSPAKFAQELERVSEPYGKIFSGADKAQMDGFVKLMRHVERAGHYMENPPTGNRLTPLALAGATTATAMTNAPLALFGVGSTYGMSKLFTTETGKRILLASKDLPPDSPKLAYLLKQAQKLASTTGAVAATE